MPISDGYEACQNISALYNDNKIFKLGQNSSSSLKGKFKGKNYNISCNVQIQDYKPIIVACTGYVDEEIIK